MKTLMTAFAALATSLMATSCVIEIKPPVERTTYTNSQTSEKPDLVICKNLTTGRKIITETTQK